MAMGRVLGSGTKMIAIHVLMKLTVGKTYIDFLIMKYIVIRFFKSGRFMSTGGSCRQIYLDKK